MNWAAGKSESVAPTGISGHRRRLWRGSLISTDSEPELFATYSALAGDAREVVGEHVEHMLGQIEAIIAAGVKSGDFRKLDTNTTALAIFDATSRFPYPGIAHLWTGAGEAAAFAQLLDLLLDGLAFAPSRRRKSSG